MPRISFDRLPDDARLWVFGADRELDEADSAVLLEAVDAFLDQWRAHGAPLDCARDWRHGRFLAVAVDQAATDASGCSIDGLFRVLGALEERIGASLLGGGRVYWRDADGVIRGGAREEFRNAATAGAVGTDTRVFDTTVSAVGEWRARFERDAATSWHARFLSQPT